MKIVTLAVLLASLAPITVLGNTLKAEHHRRVDYARVTHVTPIYNTVERRVPHKECWTERVPVKTKYPRRSHHSSATPTILGGVIGGAIGHAVGSGKTNKKVGAAIGAIVGASVGNDIGKQHYHKPRPKKRFKDVKRCEVHYNTETEQQLSGYQVDYRYFGQTYTTEMSEHPGKKIKVLVKVEPVMAY